MKNDVVFFLGKEIPIDKLKGRTRDVWGPLYSIGECKILGQSNGSIMMEIIKSPITKNVNKILFVSNKKFFMSLSEEQIDNIELKLPAINLTSNVRLYEKK